MKELGKWDKAIKDNFIMRQEFSLSPKARVYILLLLFLFIYVCIYVLIN